MKSFVSRGVFVLTGFLAVPGIPKATPPAPVADIRNDPRLSRLKQFFASHGCPVLSNAEDFLIAADVNHLDWRLLPSISIVESGGGKNARNNNVLGWGSALSKFPSVRAAIHTVAQRLANSKLYRNKDLEGVLRTYNTSAEYPARVKQVMTAIGPANARLAFAAD